MSHAVLVAVRRIQLNKIMKGNIMRNKSSFFEQWEDNDSKRDEIWETNLDDILDSIEREFICHPVQGESYDREEVLRSNKCPECGGELHRRWIRKKSGRSHPIRACNDCYFSYEYVSSKQFEWQIEADKTL